MANWEAKRDAQLRRCSIGIFNPGKKCGIVGRNIGYAASLFIGNFYCANSVVDNLNALLPVAIHFSALNTMIFSTNSRMISPVSS